MKTIIFTLLMITSVSAMAQEKKPVPGAENEAVTVRDLATHLGLADQDAVFSTPRDFRDDNLNELAIEPLAPEETAQEQKHN